MKTTQLIFFAVAMLPQAGFGQAPPTDLARQAKAVLQTHCYKCHGEGGNAEAGMFVLNYEKLIDTKKVVPKNLKGSRIYTRLAIDQDMPPETTDDGVAIPRPSEKDVATIKAWIEAGASNFAEAAPPKRDFISNLDVLKSIFADLGKARERDRKFQRYFTITHLYNAGLADDELVSYRVGLSKLVNSLSWGREIQSPQPIDAAKTIFRIDLREFEWDESVWDAILAANPYGVTYSNETAKSCYSYTQTPLPYVRADWFVFAASKPPLYHQALRLPETAGELEQRLELDVAKNIRQERVWRAGFNSSGVSRNNRLVERHRSPYGAYWKSYDFAGNVGRKNLFEHPLGPGDKSGEFQHDGGELIFNLPNGLQAYFLTDANGNRLDKGPTSIVSDPKQGDRAVVNGVSCMSCHAQGMILKQDQIRAHVENNPKAFDKSERELILALYPKKDEFDAKLKEDAERFQRAVKETGAHLSKTEPVYLLAKQFENEVDVRLAAAEAGVTVADFKTGLDRSAPLARVFGPLKAPGGTIQRDVLVASFADLVRELQPGGTFFAHRIRPSETATTEKNGDRTKITTKAADEAKEKKEASTAKEKREKPTGSANGIDFVVDKVTRSGTKVTLHIVGTNNQIQIILAPSKIDAVDTDGNAYTGAPPRAGKVTFRRDVKARFEIVFANVPASVTEFSQVEIGQFDRYSGEGSRMLGARLDPLQLNDVRIGK